MKKNILFVDDDRILRNLVSKKLKPHSESIRTLLAADGIEAIKILEESHISLEIKDLQMLKWTAMLCLPKSRESILIQIRSFSIFHTEEDTFCLVP